MEITKIFLSFIVNNKESLDTHTYHVLAKGKFTVHFISGQFELELIQSDTRISSPYIIPIEGSSSKYYFTEELGSKLLAPPVENQPARVEMSYSDQLRHELWKKKRDYIVEQRGNKCERCGSTSKLQVHHTKYIKGRFAWEYEDSLLECLCGECHMEEHGIKEKESTLTKRWLEKNTLPQARAVCISSSKHLLITYCQNEIVNYIVNNLTMLSLNATTIRFATRDKNFYKHLKVLFGDIVESESNAIRFDLNIVRKKLKKKRSK